MSLEQYMESTKDLVDKEIMQVFQEASIPRRLKESMIYSLKAGGKRIRPILLFASNYAYGGTNSKVIKSALALEMIHTYSLIHDDLPAMDDDDLRRGLPTNHKQFDEATAILAGDALLTYSFELIMQDEKLSPIEKNIIVQKLAKASGPEGMIAGQMLDLEAENQNIPLKDLEQIHNFKTGALIEFAVTVGAYLAGATEQQLNYLQQYAFYIGLIFQVQDDLLDVFGDEEKLGKPVGSDEANEKSTYPKLLGVDGAISRKERYVEKANNALIKAGAGNSYLTELIDLISERDH